MSDEIVKILEAMLVLAFQGAMLAFFIVMAILDRRAFRRHWKAGLAVGVVCFLMMAPSVAFSIGHFDPAALWKGSDLPFSMDHFAGVFIVVVLFAAFSALLVQAGWHMVVYNVAAAEWGKMRPDALPLLEKTGTVPWAWILGGCAFGLAAGGLSTLVFWAAGVDEGEAIKELRQLFPGVSEASLLVRVPVTLLAVSAPAIVEELAFRGGMLGFLLRLSGNNRAAIAGSVIAVSFLWALIHVPNTDAPLVKCAQIFIIGVVLAELARRSCIEAAIAGHLGLNVAATVAAFTVFPEA